jgi:hypothetical protein
MRTALIIAAGLALLAVAVFVGRLVSPVTGMVLAAKVFIPVWLAVAAVNMWAGVTRAGYSVMEELPIFLLLFAVPAAAAVALIFKLR